MFVNIFSWMIWILTAAIALYWYLTKRHNHWKHVGIPYVPALPVLGTFGGLFTKPVHEVDLERHLTKGRIYGCYEGRKPTLMVDDPDIVRDILVKDFHFFSDRRNITNFLIAGGDQIPKCMLPYANGETWKRIRTLITPTFTTGKIKKMTSIFIDSAKTLSGNFRNAAVERKTVDMKRFFDAFAMDVIASCAFGTKLDSHRDPNNPFVSPARVFSNKKITWRPIFLILLPGLAKFFGIRLLPPAPLEFFRNLTLKIIKERKQSGQKRNDFLQLMMDAETELDREEHVIEKDALSELGHEEINDEILKPTRGLRSLSHDEMVAQSMTFFIVGHGTTVSTLAIVTHELALNPDIQEQLIAEIDEAIGEKGELTYETVSEMRYLDCVVKETLRKYPPGMRTERMAKDDYVIKSHNVTVTKGMAVGISIYSVHHDPEYYPNPEKFDPDRFTPEMKASMHPFAYMPFGAGPRNCVAMRLALMEIKLCLAYILSQFRFHTCSETAVPLQFSIGQAILTPKEVMLKIELRADSKLL